jgi:hypothetical protein
MAQVVLPGKYKALNSNSSAVPPKKPKVKQNKNYLLYL